MAVFVLDRSGMPLMPCSEKRARLLLARGRARVHRLHPLVIRLVDRQVASCSFRPLRIKLDPGSKTTGMALVREQAGTLFALNLFELVHRDRQISEALTARRALRRARRSRNTRYRASRFLNRGNKRRGWLPPSLQHRINTTIAWVARFRHWAPITSISMELVRFDMQAMENPEIEGVEYQQGTLAGYEVREYLLEKWGRKCIYCDQVHVLLQVEHIHPKAKGGTNRVSNLGLACESCNQKKGAQDVREFLANEPERLKRILAHVKRPLKDAAAVNATRWALFGNLKTTGLPVEAASGGRTKFNRTRLSILKTHALDAICVGAVEAVQGWQRPSLHIKATGRGAYQRTRLTAHGFPRGYLMRQKQVQGFQTSDLVIASVPTGKKAGRYMGRTAVRKTGRFNIQTAAGVIEGISYKHCRVVQRNDGYAYSVTNKSDAGASSRLPPPAKAEGYPVAERKL